MKMADFLERIPDAFALEVMEALPAPERKELVRRHGAKVKVRAHRARNRLRELGRRSGGRTGGSHG